MCWLVLQEPDLAGQLSLAGCRNQSRSGRIHTGQIHETPDEQGGVGGVICDIHIVEQDANRRSGSVRSGNKSRTTGRQVTAQGGASLHNLAAILDDRTCEVLGQLDAHRHLILHIEQNLNRGSASSFLDTRLIEHVVFLLMLLVFEVGAFGCGLVDLCQSLAQALSPSLGLARRIVGTASAGTTRGFCEKRRVLGLEFLHDLLHRHGFGNLGLSQDDDIIQILRIDSSSQCGHLHLQFGCLGLSLSLCGLSRSLGFSIQLCLGFTRIKGGFDVLQGVLEALVVLDIKSQFLEDCLTGSALLVSHHGVQLLLCVGFSRRFSRGLSGRCGRLCRRLCGGFSGRVSKKLKPNTLQGVSDVLFHCSFLLTISMLTVHGNGNPAELYHPQTGKGHH
nr:MAG TPA: hypothetical protein [Caudoviricetes sp.]